MKGIIFNILEETVAGAYGPAVWEDVLARTGLQGAYTSLGDYGDDELVSLVASASDALSLSPNEVLHWFGIASMPHLRDRFPSLFRNHRSARDFISSANSIIHPEVRKLYTGANCPHFHFQRVDEDTLLAGYRSPRRLCALAHGFVEGAGRMFCETIEVEHLRCMHDGHEACLLELRWVH